MLTEFLTMKNEAGEIELSIKPDEIIFMDEVYLTLSNNELLVDNLIRFYSFRYPSRRIIRQISGIIESFSGKGRPLGIVSEANLEVNDKFATMRFRFRSILDPSHRAMMVFIKRVFSAILNAIPEYSVREYNILPISEDKIKVNILLLPHEDRLKRTYRLLSMFVRGTIASLPNRSGDYYLSWYGIDNINKPPRILERIIRLLMDKNNIENKITESNLADFIRDLANLADKIDFKAIRSLMMTIHNIFRGVPLSKNQIEETLRLLDSLLRQHKNIGHLLDIYLHLKNLNDRLRLLEKLEEITLLRVLLKRLTRMLGKIPLQDQKSFLKNYILTGQILGSCKKRVIKLGGGKAIYLSPNEWKTLVGNTNSNGEEELEVKIIKRPDGSKILVVEFA